MGESLGKVVATLLVLTLLLGGMGNVYVEATDTGYPQGFALVKLTDPGIVQYLRSLGFNVIEEYPTFVLVSYPVDSKIAQTLLTDPRFIRIDYSLKFASGVVPEESLKKLNVKPESLAQGLYVVQLVGPPTDRWLEHLHSMAHFLAYVPPYGYIVKVPRPVSFFDLPFVVGVYPYQDRWKMGNALVKRLEGAEKNETLRIAVIIDPTVSDPVSVAEELSHQYGITLDTHPGRIGGVIIDTGGGLRYKFYGTIEVGSIPNLLSDPRVVIVDYAPKMTFFNAMAAKIVGVESARDSTLNGLGVSLTGSDQVVAIADTGLDSGNPNNIVDDFAGRVLTIYDAAGDGDPSDPDNGDLGGHGTHVAGSVAGSGVMSGADPSTHRYNGSFAGMAPEASIHFESIGTVTSQGGGLTYDSITSMATRAYNDGARIWTNSWGKSYNTYTSDSQEVDQFMWTHKDFLILFAAGNSGPKANTVGSPATAKNIITVGASENLVPHVAGQGLNQYSMADDPDQLAYFSSRGPTADGRIKPDLVAPGAGIVSVRATTVSDSNIEASWIIPTDNNNDGKFDYMAMQGTSMATPIAAGTMVLIRQYFTDYENLNDPSAALLKATALVGTDILPGYAFGGFDQGWGRLDIAGSLFPTPPSAFKYWDWQSVTSGGVWEQQINVEDPTVPLRIVLAWTDYPGSENANPALVNDLDLVVVAPDGTEYHGNVFDSTTLNSQPDPSTYDRLNNVEVVRVTQPQIGVWTIRVLGYNIAQDDPDGPNNLDQTFAVTVRGGIGPQKVRNVKLLRKRMDSDQWTYDELSLQAVRGDEITIPLKVINWGLSDATYNIGYTSSSSDVTVMLSMNQVSLQSGQSAQFEATLDVSSSASSGMYSVTIYAEDASDPSYRQSITVRLAVMDPVYVPREQVTHTTENVTMETTSSIAIDPTDGSIWIAYFRQSQERSGNPYTDSSLGNGDNFDLVIAHSTDGGRTWAEYVPLTNFDRYYNYLGSEEQVIDWFYWYPQIEVDSNGRVYVAFSTLRHIYVVSGDESGFQVTKLADEAYTSSSQLFGTRYIKDMIYPWVTLASYGPDKVAVVYTYQHLEYTRNIWGTTLNEAYRVLNYTVTTDGGNTWSTPSLINPSYAGTTNDDKEYMPSAVYDGSRIWVFFAGNTSSDLTYYLKYYTYDGTSWSGPTTLYSDSTVYFPSAFVDSSGRVWVAFYVPTGSFSSFKVYSWGLRLMYYDGSWHGPYAIDDYVANSYPPALSEFKGKIWIAYSEASYYDGNSPQYNNKWPYSTYALKVAAFDPATNTVAERRYLSSGAWTNFHVDGDNEAHEGIYYSYTTTYDWLNDEVTAVAYTGNTYSFVWPTPMDKGKTDLNWARIGLRPEYPVDSIQLSVSGASGTQSYDMAPSRGTWLYNVTSLDDGSHTYSVSIKAIGETITGSPRTVIVDTSAPDYIGPLINGDPSDWAGDENQVNPGSTQILDGVLVWRDAADNPLYNMEIVKITADESYIYMLIDPSDMANTGHQPNLYLEVWIDSDNDGTYDYKAVADLSQYSIRDSTVRKLNLFDLSTGEQVGDSNTIFESSEDNGVIELQIPRNLIGNPSGEIRIRVVDYQTNGAGNLVSLEDTMTEGGNDYTILDISNVPVFSSSLLAVLMLVGLVMFFRRT